MAQQSNIVQHLAQTAVQTQLLLVLMAAVAYVSEQVAQ